MKHIHSDPSLAPVGPVEVERGTLVLLHLHMHAALLAFARYSEPNTSGHFRNAIVIHFVEGTDDSKFLAGYPADFPGAKVMGSSEKK